MNLFGKYADRNSSVEILRMIFMAGIVILHAYYHGSDANIEWIYGLGTSSDSSYQLMLYSLSRLGVTGFMFISGYYGIRMNAIRLYRLLSMVALYWIVTTIASGNFGIGGLVKGVIHAWDMWWFVASYFMICILSPLINDGIDRISKKTFSYVILGIVLYTYIGHFIIGMDSHDTDLLLSIYLIARYLRICITPLSLCKKKSLLVICIISTVSLMLLPIIVMRVCGNVKITDMLICNNSPIVLISAGAMVMLFDKCNLHIGFVNWLASSTFAIYLITESSFRMRIDCWLFQNIFKNPLYGYFLIVIVCSICMFIDKIRLLLFKPIDKYIERYLVFL